ncbi:MAG: hypothetical protein ACOCRK_02030 [bacterium]
MTYKRNIQCPLCSYKSKNETMVESHIKSTHRGYLNKKGYTAKELLYRARNSDNPNIGKCIECGDDVKWDKTKEKYPRICDKKSCKNKAHNKHKENTKNKYGVEYRLRDPKYQRMMLKNHKDSKKYEWSNNGKVFDVVGNIEYELLEKIDRLNLLDYKDIQAPADFNIMYRTPDGKKHNHFPDFYVKSLNLIISCKDGLENPNTHPGFKKDRLKNLCEYRTILNDTDYNYVQIEGKEDIKKIESILKAVKKSVRANSRYVMPPRIDFVMYNESPEMIDLSIDLNYLLIGLKDDLPVFFMLSRDILDSTELYHFNGKDLLVFDGESILNDLNFYCIDLQHTENTIDALKIYNNLGTFKNESMIDIVAYFLGVPGEYTLKEKIESVIDNVGGESSFILYREYLEDFDKKINGLENHISEDIPKWIDEN